MEPSSLPDGVVFLLGVSPDTLLDYSPDTLLDYSPDTLLDTLLVSPDTLSGSVQIHYWRALLGRYSHGRNKARASQCVLNYNT